MSDLDPGNQEIVESLWRYVQEWQARGGLLREEIPYGVPYHRESSFQVRRHEHGLWYGSADHPEPIRLSKYRLRKIKTIEELAELIEIANAIRNVRES